MSILKLAMFFISAALIGAASYNATFETSYICNSSATGTSIGNFGNVASSIVCGMTCANNLSCESFLFISVNSTCFLMASYVTDEQADEQACDSTVLYGKKAREKELGVPFTFKIKAPKALKGVGLKYIYGRLINQAYPKSDGLYYQMSVETKSCTEPVGNVRLCNGSRNSTARAYKGRVEVFVDNQWGSVCDDLWGDYYTADYYIGVYDDFIGSNMYFSTNAIVVCKMLEFEGGYALLNATFGESRGSVLLSKVSCGGRETSIMDCEREKNTTHCGHENDVGVLCV